jgi:hypothetical protein
MATGVLYLAIWSAFEARTIEVMVLNRWFPIATGLRRTIAPDR